MGADGTDFEWERHGESCRFLLQGRPSNGSQLLDWAPSVNEMRDSLILWPVSGREFPMDTDVTGEDGSVEHPPIVVDRRDPQTYEIIGAAMEVHSELGAGFLEAVYQEALAVEFTIRSVPFERERVVPVSYKGQQLACGYRADFVGFESILIELKSVARLGVIEQAQILNYLKATGMKKGLLVNFGTQRLEYRRFVNGHSNL
jgi:GxxExxY protein